MATVTIKCPVSGDDVATDVELDVDAYNAATLEDNQIKCSSCNRWHQWTKKDTFLV
jgi:hypothetical protein